MAQAQLLRALSVRWLMSASAALAGGALLGLAAPLGAQNTGTIDLARIRARAAKQAKDAEAFSHVVARRGEEQRKAAERLSAAVRAIASRSSRDAPGGRADPFDFDAMVRTAGAASTPDAAPRLLVFASLSMPVAALRQLIDDTTRAGGSIVFRGLPGNSMRAFTTALARALPPGEVRANVGIDPRLFRAFSVETVPTYVVTGSAIDLCDGLDCRSTPPPHDSLRGNVTLDFALRTFAEGEGPSAFAAQTFVSRLEAAR